MPHGGRNFLLFTGFPDYYVSINFFQSDPKDKLLLNEILAVSDINFTQWVINEILNWKSAVSPEKIIRIHGDNDRVLPIINFKPDYLIKEGGHFMVVNRAGEISKIIDKEIRKIDNYQFTIDNGNVLS